MFPVEHQPPQAEEPPVCRGQRSCGYVDPTQQLLCVSLLLSLGEFTSCSLPCSLLPCMLLLQFGQWFSTARNKSLTPGSIPAAREAASAVLCLANVPDFGPSTFLLDLHLAKRGGGRLRGISRFPLGKIFSPGGSLSWALAAASGSWLEELG